MNTKVVLNTKPKELPYLPPLSYVKSNRVITKHFVNLSIELPKREYALLTWLIYQCETDNSFKYNTHLLKKYSATIRELNANLPVSVQLIRKEFIKLVEKGYLIPKFNRFVINPMLTYSLTWKVERDELCKRYQIVKDWKDLFSK